MSIFTHDIIHTSRYKYPLFVRLYVKFLGFHSFLCSPQLSFRFICRLSGTVKIRAPRWAPFCHTFLRSDISLIFLEGLILIRSEERTRNPQRTSRGIVGSPPQTVPREGVTQPRLNSALNSQKALSLSLQNFFSYIILKHVCTP